MTLLGMLANLALSIVASELCDWLPSWSEHIVRRAARRLPETYRERLLQEWLAELHCVPGRLWKLKFALGLFLTDWSSLTGDTPEAVQRLTKALPQSKALFFIIWAAYFILFVVLTFDDNSSSEGFSRQLLNVAGAAAVIVVCAILLSRRIKRRSS
jgi:hypothetical protein